MGRADGRELGGRLSSIEGRRNAWMRERGEGVQSR
jgi:hypothetical protein